MKRFLLCILVLVAISACAPSVSTSTSVNTVSSPILTDSIEILGAKSEVISEVQKGKTYYIRNTVPLGFLNVNTNEVTRILHVSSDVKVGDVISKDVDWFKLIEKFGPDGWDIRLKSSKVLRIINAVQSQPEYGQKATTYSSYFIEFTFTLLVPESAEPSPTGIWGMWAGLESNRGQVAATSFTFQVVE